MNVLISCVGRRSYLVEYFKSALKEYGGKVIGTNSEALTAGMLACDSSFVVPQVDDELYIPTLLKIAQDENVSMILSLFDIDLPYLAKAKELFKQHNIEVIISSEKVIEISNDKWQTYDFLKENEFKTPKTFIHLDEAISAIQNNTLKYPLFVKPRFGTGAIGVYKADDQEELIFFYHYVQKRIKNSYLNKQSSQQPDELVVIQEAVLDREFGIDIFNDLDGNFIMSVVKEKLAQRSGETDIAIVVENQELSILAKKLSEILRHVGNLDVDVLYDGKNYYILEFNARFGGGFPFSYLAGADFVKLLVDMLKCKPLSLPHMSIGTQSLKAILPMKALNERS